MARWWKNKRWIGSLIRVAMALLVSILLFQFPLHYLEAIVYDSFFRALPSSKKTAPISIIGIDRSTIENLKREPKLSDHTQILKSLTDAKVKGVLYLINPILLNASSQDQVAFARQAAEIENFMVSIEELPLAGTEDKFQLPYPMHLINLQPGILSKDSHNFAGDSVSRRALISYEGKYFVQAQMAKILSPDLDISQSKGLFSFKGSQQVLVNLKPKASFQKISFLDLLEGKVDLSQLEGRLVILSQDAESNADNYVMTPYSRDVTAMSKAEYNANIINNLIENNSIEKSPEKVSFFLCFLISIITIFITFKLRPLRGISSLLSLAIAVYAFSLMLFSAGFWIPIAHPLLSIFLCYYLLIPYRLIQENKKSWEYQQKNRLLTQVEELKNNFISMMSHDLKTPLARIQGMAEIAISDKHPLSQEQLDALTSISRSSEELSLFVSSVLNFGRLESQGVKLNLESKDPNKIIEDVVKKYKYLAEQKSIDIQLELEPIFSASLDEDLFKQVIQNLVENAIKYSPEGSKILVSSEEVDEQISIQVSDQGQGIPEDELDKIFMKFYRSKNAKSSAVKGTGLGLYLTKYFVELHRGNIEVDSVIDSGSTFTIKIPTQLGV